VVCFSLSPSYTSAKTYSSNSERSIHV